MLTLIDLSSVYWPNWFATQSGIRAYDITMERIDWFRREFPRIVACADSPRSKRREWCETYKAQREKKPQEAIDALMSVQQRLEAWGVPVVQRDGYEGEDIVATLCAQAWPEEIQILGTDKDLYALISDTVWIAGKRGKIDSNGCYEWWGVTPAQMTEFLALTGDASDNIEGCAGCGPGRAALLLERFGTIEGIRAATDDEILSIKGIGKTTLESLRAWDPTMALKLVKLMTDAPVVLDELLEVT